jgi:hypothetical protein
MLHLIRKLHAYQQNTDKSVKLGQPVIKILASHVFLTMTKLFKVCGI